MLPTGRRSPEAAALPKSRSHSSNWVSFEKSASTAPALVAVAISGGAGPVDQVKVAVRGISRRRTMAYVVSKHVESGRHLRARFMKDSSGETWFVAVAVVLLSGSAFFFCGIDSMGEGDVVSA